MYARGEYSGCRTWDLPLPPDLIHGIFWNHRDRPQAETQIYWIDALAGKILMARELQSLYEPFIKNDLMTGIA
jgi:hypothetical protein